MISTALRTAEAQAMDIRRFLALSEKKADAVKQIIDAIDPERVDTPTEEWAREVAAFTTGRTYDYVCAIILVYGLLERFVEDLAEEYLDALVARAGSFSSLPDKLRQSHLELTIQQILRSRDSRYKGKHDAPRLAASLSACLSDSNPIDLLYEPFLHHTANFRVPAVDDFLGRIGISQASRRAVRTQAFVDYNGAQVDEKEVPAESPESVWDLINDLVERRNQVAHGDASDALAPSKLRPYCDLTEAYCRALARVTRDSLAGLLVEQCGVAHDHPIDVFNHNIVCINSKGVEFRPGSLLVCKASDEPWYSLVVQEVQVDRLKVAASPKGQDIPVGLLTDGRCRPTHCVFSVA